MPSGDTTPAQSGVPSCSHCHAPAVESIRYNGTHLCRTHFLASVEDRVKKEIRRQGGIPEKSVIGVGVSGGKDSIVTLRLLHRILQPRLQPGFGGSNPRGDIRLLALTIDEGIAGYRPAGLELAARTAAELGMPHKTLAYRDLVGVTMDEAHTVKGEQNECTFCGVFRRAALNRLARDAGCTLVATGHNLDDNAQAVLMNVAGGDVARLARLGPHEIVQEGLVPRRMPVRVIPEKELYLTAMLEGWPVEHAECPYSVNAQRGLFRDVLLRLEAATPGTRHAMLASLDTLRPVLSLVDAARGKPLATCRRCGEPSSGDLCKACELGATLRTRLAARADPARAPSSVSTTTTLPAAP